MVFSNYLKFLSKKREFFQMNFKTSYWYYQSKPKDIVLFSSSNKALALHWRMYFSYATRTGQYLLD